MLRARDRGVQDVFRSGRGSVAAEDAIHVQTIKAVPEKVDLVEFHPVSPWLAYVTRENTVAVWDYNSDQLIYTNHFGGTDEAALQIQALESRAASVLPAASGASHSQGRDAAVGVKSTASGDVKAILFLDLDVIYWTLARQMSQQQGSFDGTNMPSLDATRRRLGSHRWLVVACENKIVAHDLTSPEVIDLPRSSLFEGKIPTTISLLLSNSRSLLKDSSESKSGGTEILPLLAVGTNAGSIFVVSIDKLKVHAKLAGAHKGAITSLLTIPGRSTGAPDRLLSAGMDGNVAVWDPSHTPGRGVENEVSPISTFKAHDGAARDLRYFALPGIGADNVNFGLATVGDDRNVCIWDGASFKLTAKEQPLGKVGFNTVEFLAGGEVAVGAGPCLVLTSRDAPQIVGFNPTSGNSVPLLDVTGLLDPGLKKIPKIYSSAVHPVRTHMMALATNTGIAILSSDSSFLPSVVAIPSSVMHLESNDDQEQAQPTSGARGAQGYTYLSALAGSLVASSVRMEAKRIEGKSERGVSLSVFGQPVIIAKFDQIGCPILSTSPSGHSIAAVWPEAKTYTVFSFAPSGIWEVVDKGAATQLAWSTTNAVYAVLSPPPVEVTRIKQRKGLNFFNRARKDKADKEEHTHVIGAAAVIVHSIDEQQGIHSIISQDINADGDVRILHGGAMLGVVRYKSGENEPVLQFYSWSSFMPVGPELPEPLWISWEPECTLVALAYYQSVEICRTYPVFERFATLAISDSTSGLWQSRQLIVATPTSLHAVFADPTEGFVQSLTLASLAGTSFANVLGHDDENSALPAQQLRPPGPVVLCGIRHSYLWLADYLGRPFLISLRHPGVRVRCLAARGELDLARSIADRGLNAGFHDEIARFLVAMGGDDGIFEALKLSGLTPRAEFGLCAQVGEWDRAASAFQIMALGVEDRGLLSLASHTMAVSAPIVDAVEAEAVEEEDVRPDLVAQILEEATRAEHTTPFEVVENAKTDSEDESDGSEDGERKASQKLAYVDWDAALRSQELSNEATPTYEPAQAQRLVISGDAHTAQIIAQQGISFAESAIAAGQSDAARAVLGVLVLLANDLPSHILEDLVFKLGVCSMTESARSLSESVSFSGSALRDPAVAASLAALIGGKDGLSVRRTLRAARLAPLAAVYGAVWGGAELDPLLEDWSNLLSSASAVSVIPPEA